MGIRDKEKARQGFISNVSAITGVENKADVPANDDDKLTQKAYYITKGQYRKLRILAAETEKDMSCLVREILDQYFNGKSGV